MSVPGGRDLDGNNTGEVLVAGAIDFSHTAAELFDDAVVRDSLADHWSRILRL